MNTLKSFFRDEAMSGRYWHEESSRHTTANMTSSLATIRCPAFITCQTDVDSVESTTLPSMAAWESSSLEVWPHCVQQQNKNSCDLMQWSALFGNVTLHILWKMPGTSSQPEGIDEEKDSIRTIQLGESESKQKGSAQEEPNTDTATTFMGIKYLSICNNVCKLKCRVNVAWCRHAKKTSEFRLSKLSYVRTLTRKSQEKGKVQRTFFKATGNFAHWKPQSERCCM